MALNQYLVGESKMGHNVLREPPFSLATSPEPVILAPENFHAFPHERATSLLTPFR
jgi:hypothetical protein